MSLESIHSRLLAWYDKEKRDLPWRRSRDPYRIWLSEIMLQQTRVETVLPYFARFTSNFPTVRDLAEASEDSVLNLWAGLGYYSRARNLHAAAKQIVADFSGVFPSSIEKLLRLRGVGPYTAAAIASIAFDSPHCALDGNLERVFSRLLALEEDPKTKGRPKLYAFGQSLVEKGRAGDTNQAVMDLSSAICLPQKPRCPLCPLQKNCEARRLGLEERLPLKKAKSEKIHLQAQAWAVVVKEQLLLARREPGEWLAGMWDLPWAVREAESVRPDAPFGEQFAECTNTRTITKHKIDFSVRGILSASRPSSMQLSRLCASKEENLRWVPLRDLHGLNLPRPSEKALEKILPKLKWETTPEEQ